MKHQQEQKLQSFYEENRHEELKDQHEPYYEKQEYEESRNENAEELFCWSGPEYEMNPKSTQWYALSGGALTLIVAYALYTNSPIMAITFILIGVVGYLYVSREPRTVTFTVTDKGVSIGDELYEFDSMRSFWIFYEPKGEKYVSFLMKGTVVPFVHLPLHDTDPIELREVLLNHIDEVKQQQTLADTIERFLRA
jgi:hypothetical protein